MQRHLPDPVLPARGGRAAGADRSSGAGPRRSSASRSPSTPARPTIRAGRSRRPTATGRCTGNATARHESCAAPSTRPPTGGSRAASRAMSPSPARRWPAPPATGPADVVVVESPPLFLAGAAIPYARIKRARARRQRRRPLARLGDRDRGARARPPRSAVRGPSSGPLTGAAAAISCPTEGIVATLEARPESGRQGGADAPRGRSRSLRPDPAARWRRRRRAPARGCSTQVRSAWRTGWARCSMRSPSSSPAPDSPPLDVVIAGDGAEAPQLRARLAAGGPASVRMLGSVASERIPALYAEADVALVILRDLPSSKARCRRRCSRRWRRAGRSSSPPGGSRRG